jgi:hypothetical protein
LVEERGNGDSWEKQGWLRGMSRAEQLSSTVSYKLCKLNVQQLPYMKQEQ